MQTPHGYRQVRKQHMLASPNAPSAPHLNTLSHRCFPSCHSMQRQCGFRRATRRRIHTTRMPPSSASNLPVTDAESSVRRCKYNWTRRWQLSLSSPAPLICLSPHSRHEQSCQSIPVWMTLQHDVRLACCGVSSTETHIGCRQARNDPVRMPFQLKF